MSQNPVPCITSRALFQGYTILGSSLYTLDGSGHADAADIDSYVTRIDTNTGTVQDRDLTRAVGFGSRSSMDNVNRYANLFCKNVLVG
ncbi:MULTISPECIES: hypothetical protein [unclassified Amycolatopsis]|uniref:hypothetical protein n=1 Tax=unclassified Amycolatopsis TaxID=2618356 RepID=UPI00287BA6A2|nr:MULTISPECIES: hypothetical protein [unclassified Amycolatopsis]